MKTLHFIYFAAFVLFACSNDDNPASPNTEIKLVNSSWRLVTLTENQKNIVPDSDKSYILKFVSDTIFNIQLKVNKSRGFFKVNEALQIETISYFATTELCCDRGFDEDILRLMPQMKSITITADRLIFKNPESQFLFERSN